MLTDQDRLLLNAHEGCNKCRRFYAGHWADTCPNDYPDPATYQPLTYELAIEAKYSSRAALPIAATSSGYRGGYQSRGYNRGSHAQDFELRIERHLEEAKCG